jgi:hypothetical protein
MSGFLYFLPTAKQCVDASDLRALGLEHALRVDAGITCNRTESGPGNLAGLTIVIDGDDMQAGFYEGKQTWRKARGGKFFVGIQNDRRPGPDDLARERLYEGTPVRLLDGNDWIVPRCFGILEDRPSTLPRALDLDDEGESVITAVHPRFEKLCHGAFDFWMEWSNQAPQKLTAEQRIQLALDALAANYRIGRVEAIGLLKLLDTDSFAKVLRAMIDADEIEQYAQAQLQKKSTSAAGASAISSGVKES